jgi:hypothetical protein
LFSFSPIHKIGVKILDRDKKILVQKIENLEQLEKIKLQPKALNGVQKNQFFQKT